MICSNQREGRSASIENRKIASLTPLSYHFDRHEAAGLSRTLSLILARDDDVGGEER